MPYVTRQRTRIWYDVFGHGPPLILLQGLGFSHRYWLELPQRLAEQFQVVVVDNRGTGCSTCASSLFFVRDMADDTLAVLRELALSDCLVVGISLGGMVAQEVALRSAPGEIGSLSLLVTTCGFPQGRVPRLRSLLKLCTAAALPSRKRLRAARQMLLSPSNADRADELFRVHEQIAVSESISGWTYARQILAAATHNTGRRLRRIACPTLVVSGQDDQLIPPENSRILTRLIPNAKLVEMPATGHALSVERLDEVWRQLVAFRLSGPIWSDSTH